MKSPDRDAADEHMEAIILANRILDRVNADPDDDLAVLARQFLRGEERISALETAAGNAAGRWRDALETDVEVMRTLDTMEDQMCFIKLEKLLKLPSPLPPGRNEG